MLTLVSVFVLGMFPGNWHHIEELQWEILCLDQVPMKLNRMTEDLVELAADHPTFERLCARFYVGRALDSCDFAFAAQPKDIDDFSKGIELDPKYARAYVYRGQVNNGRSERERAADLVRAIELDPKGKATHAAYLELAYLESGVYAKSTQYEKAIKIYDKMILNSSPSSSEEDLMNCYLCRACMYEKLGRYQMAIDDYSKAISIDPKNYGQHKSRGLAYGHLEITNKS